MLAVYLIFVERVKTARLLKRQAYEEKQIALFCCSETRWDRPSYQSYHQEVVRRKLYEWKLYPRVGHGLDPLVSQLRTQYIADLFETYPLPTQPVEWITAEA
jgi:hypothetical protein